MVYDYLSFGSGAATSSHFHTVGHASHLLSLNRLCVCVLKCSHWVKKIGWRNQRGHMDELWRSHRTIGKLTNGPIPQKHGVGYDFKSSYLCGQRLSCALILEKKSFTCALPSQKRLPRHQRPSRDQTALKKRGTLYWLMITAQASHLLHHSHFLAVDHSALLGAREKVHASFPLNPLALFPSVPDFWYPSMREICYWWISRSICYQSESLPLSPCHPYLIKNIMDTWLCFWLDSLKN